MDRNGWVVLGGALLAGALACGLGGTSIPPPPPPPPDAGSPPTGALVACEWNLEWFGDTSHDPTDESLQLQNVTQVIADAGCDLFAVEEVVDPNAWAQVVSDLRTSDGDDYGSVLATDSTVTNAGAYSGAQKVGLLYRKSVFDLVSGDVLGSPINSYDFAERPPLEVKLNFHTPSGLVPLTVIVLHMKAQFSQTDGTSYQKRLYASQQLKSYLDASHPSDRVMVMGDWNDDVDQSIYQSQPSPYGNFVDAGTAYEFPTAVLTAEGTAGATTLTGTDTIDHQMITNELFGAYVASSTQVLHPQIPGYGGNNTSDHYPTLVRYQF